MRAKDGHGAATVAEVLALDAGGGACNQGEEKI